MDIAQEICTEGCYIVNSGLPHVAVTAVAGEVSCGSNFFKTCVKVVLKILVALPLWCQLIQICVPQKRCLLGIFLENFYFGTFISPPPLPMIYINGPVSRKNFGNALGKTSSHYLTVCPIRAPKKSEKVWSLTKGGGGEEELSFITMLPDPPDCHSFISSRRVKKCQIFDLLYFTSRKKGLPENWAVYWMMCDVKSKNLAKVKRESSKKIFHYQFLISDPSAALT